MCYWNSLVHNGPSRSSKVIDFGADRKRVCDFLLVLNSNLGPILPRFSNIKDFVNTLFWYPSPITAKISGCSPWSSFVMWGANIPSYLTVKLISKIIPIQPVSIHHRYRLTNGQTTYNCNTALCVASRRKNNCMPIAYRTTRISYKQRS